MGVRKLWSTVAGSEDLHSGERIALQVVSRSQTERDQECQARIVRQERPMTTKTYFDREGSRRKKTVPDHGVDPSSWVVIHEGQLSEIEKKWEELDH